MSYARRPPDDYYIYRSSHDPDCTEAHGVHEEFNVYGEDAAIQIPYDALALLLANMADRHNDELVALIERGKAMDSTVSRNLTVMALWLAGEAIPSTQDPHAEGVQTPEGEK